MNDADLHARYARLCERLDAACASSGRPREEVTLVAVSKFHPAAAVAAIAGMGQVDFGENYVQEALGKRETLTSVSPACAGLRWHMIGHVQHRKAPLVAGAFTLLHTLDSRRLADAMERHLAGTDMRQSVLMQINIGGEAQKSGLPPEDAPALAEHVVQACPHLTLLGLMCLPPVWDAGDAARPHFARLRGLREDLQKRLGLPLPHLSMGMSGDFAGAVAEGATLVRIGTEIFGPRPTKQ